MSERITDDTDRTYRIH